MTPDTHDAVSVVQEARPSLLPFNPQDLVAMRVLPSVFAGMVGVSKQTVSRWIKTGKVTLGPDGKLDPSVASRQVFERTDPARLRARVFKNAMASHGELQKKISCQEIEIKALHEKVGCIESFMVHPDDLALKNAVVVDRILENFPRLIECQADGTLEDELDRIIHLVFFPHSIYEEGMWDD